MKLRRPTDFDILEALDDTGRNVAMNLAYEIEASRKNINTRLPVLADYGLVEKIGPAERSGLYEITDFGRIAADERDRYDEVDDFAAYLIRLLERGPESTAQTGALRADGRGDD